MKAVDELKASLSKMEQLKFDMDNAWEAEQPDMEIAIDAIKKQIPRTVKNRKFINIFPYGIRGDCPICGSKNLSSAQTNHCNVCGQKLDFGNPDTLMQRKEYIEDYECDKIKSLKCEVKEISKKITNADKIRNMSIAMLAKLIENPNSFFGCNRCPHGKEKGVFCTTERCLPYIKDWLESEVE